MAEDFYEDMDAIAGTEYELIVETLTEMSNSPRGGDDRYVRNIRKHLRRMSESVVNPQKRLIITGLYYTLDPKLSMEHNATALRKWLIML